MNIFGGKTTTPATTPPKQFGQQRSKVMDKRIPTFVGVGILVLGLIAGGVLFSQGTGVFAPRATPQSTPKSIKLTNVTESSVTITYLTDAASEGSIKYGTDPETPLSRSAQVATDDRVQLGTSQTSQFKTHHITVRGLQPNTKYYYVISSSGEVYDNQGQAFSITTAQRSGAPAAAKTIYGSVTTETGTPADGAIVYVAFEGAGLLSSLVKQSGSWAVPLSNARTTDGAAYADVSDSTQLAISVQGPEMSQIATTNVAVSESQPVATLAYGQSAGTAPPSIVETPAETEVASGSAQIAASPEPIVVASESSNLITETEVSSTSASTATNSGGLSELLVPEEEPAIIIDTTTTEHQVVSTVTPLITGTALPNVVVSIEVNSETQIQQQVTAGPDGSFALDLEALKKELEPGEHTVTYSYTNPSTGQLVTETITFTVTGTENQIAQATLPTPSPTPFGTTNPVPLITSPSPTAVASISASPSPIATTTAQATRSGLPSTASGVPKSGSVGTTFALVFGGLFFIISGIWSFWIAQQVEQSSVPR